MSLPTELFDYPLPAHAIAQTPADRRENSRLMVIDRASRRVEHRCFYELPQILAGQQVELYRNTAKVIRARMWLQRASGGEVELLLLRPSAQAWVWWCLVRPAKKVKIGDTLQTKQGEKIATLREKSPTGEALLEFLQDPLQLAERLGALPLPPYIARERNDSRAQLDNERYQTVFAQQPVAAAAPTAGLHFSTQLIAQLEQDGHSFYDLALHVGLDTFRPISTDTVEAHQIHTERYSITAAAAQALREKKHPRLAIGTTSLRTMEDYIRKGAQETEAAANLYIYPPASITAADMLITNFHLPKSTLLCLVSAFLTPGSSEGIAWLKEIYAQALQEGYRFYSYGDAMIIK